VLAALIEPLIHPLTTTGIVVIFVIFILLQQTDLRNRLVRLAGAKDLHRTTAALDDAGQRLSRLFLTQLALNAAFGIVIGLALWLIGVPSAPLWGMLAMIMRFVPYIGAVISAIFPLVLAAAVGPSWAMVIMTAALFLVAETIVAATDIAYVSPAQKFLNCPGVHGITVSGMRKPRPAERARYDAPKLGDAVHAHMLGCKLSHRSIESLTRTPNWRRPAQELLEDSENR
jgi:AI-2E family transporter